MSSVDLWGSMWNDRLSGRSASGASKGSRRPLRGCGPIRAADSPRQIEKRRTDEVGHRDHGRLESLSPCRSGWPVPICWTIGRLNHAAFRVSSWRTWIGVRYPWRSRSHP